MPSPLLPHITLDQGHAPQHSIIWLHGLGADGEDFVPLAEEMQLPVAVRYIFPHAPKQPVSINGGFVMRAWYDIVATDIGSKQDVAGVRASQIEIEKFITHEIARGIIPEHIFLAGFSQGGAIALHTGVRHTARLGGIVALSTYLPLADTFAAEASAQATPIFMAHGRSDTVVPHTLGMSSAEKLRERGYELAWHDYAMAHSVNMAEVRDIEGWLRAQILNSTIPN
jgi:phospholipase/carboxylesterase